MRTSRYGASRRGSAASGVHRRWRRCGGTNANLDDYGVDTADGMRQAKVFTKSNRPIRARPPAPSPARPLTPWKTPRGRRARLHTEFEAFTLIRPRSDRHAGHTAERSPARA